MGLKQKVFTSSAIVNKKKLKTYLNQLLEDVFVMNLYDPDIKILPFHEYKKKHRDRFKPSK